ncbi:DUF305 domain-containing protein [Granulicella sp. dw_53]|uniref:DUF305 domain-containing protein n=1 Tax=Granulicella sp. dw_53 TaxID=2719792 RepID=UPI001BD6BCF4|nr:DUF305 domain-containing protein [Granulicella sp. dw_53]
MLFYLSTTATVGQSTQAATGGVVVVQPGAPGQSNKTLPSTNTTPPLGTPSDADIAFMRGMIMHHWQAVEMTALMGSRSHNQDLLALGKRISISQTDEMGFMKRWLSDRGIPLSDSADMDHMEGMAGMEHMKSMPMMPGMLTPQQMHALKEATSEQFDHLFLVGMIQHHTGALSMVKQLLDTPGACQDPILFDFTSDVDNTQQAEIDIMRHMLSKEKQ